MSCGIWTFIFIFCNAYNSTYSCMHVFHMPITTELHPQPPNSKFYSSVFSEAIKQINIAIMLTF